MMTLRSKQLAGKALDLAVPYTWTKLDYEQIHEVLAAHTKIIVEECVRVLDEDDGATHHTTCLFEHFGVK
jgi:hypothetical protein